MNTTSRAAFAQADPGPVDLVWVNSPSNPTGQVLGVEHLAKVVAWARERGAVVASDECYAELAWEGQAVPSVLDPAVCGGSHEGLLAVLLAQQAVEPGRLPLGLRRGRPRAGGPPARGAQARGDDRARAGAGRHRGRARRRRARRPAARGVPRAPRGAPHRSGRQRVPDRPLGRGLVPVGHPRRGLLGHRRLVGPARGARGPRRLLRRGGSATRPDRPHRNGSRDRCGARSGSRAEVRTGGRLRRTWGRHRTSPSTGGPRG